MTDQKLAVRTEEVHTLFSHVQVLTPIWGLSGLVLGANAPSISPGALLGFIMAKVGFIRVKMGTWWGLKGRL